MKNLFTIATLALALCVTTPGALAQNGNGIGNAGGTGVGKTGNGNGFGETGEDSDPAVIEAAAQSLSVVIAADSGGNSESYLKYARQLARTLDQKSSAELDRILGSGNHFGLGN